jgi:hypothetical protein
MEGITAIGEKRDVGEGVKVGRAGEDAAGFFVPVFDIAAIAQFGFNGGESLQKELAIVEKGERVLARDASSDLMNEDFAGYRKACRTGRAIHQVDEWLSS